MAWPTNDMQFFSGSDIFLEKRVAGIQSTWLLRKISGVHNNHFIVLLAFKRGFLLICALSLSSQKIRRREVKN